MGSWVGPAVISTFIIRQRCELFGNEEKQPGRQRFPYFKRYLHLCNRRAGSFMLQWTFKPFSELSPAELYQAMQLRQEVFVYEQKCVYVDADGKDPACYHLLGYFENELAAYARILPPGVAFDEASIGRVVTARRYRRHAYGIELMERSIIECERLFGKHPIRIGAQMYLLNFYTQFGFEPVGEPYIEDGIDHIHMLRP